MRDFSGIFQRGWEKRPSPEFVPRTPLSCMCKMQIYDLHVQSQLSMNVFIRADLSDLFLPPLFVPASDKPADECLQVIPYQTSNMFFSVQDVPANVFFPPLRLFETLKLAFLEPLMPQIEHFRHCRGEKATEERGRSSGGVCQEV